jgi:hypothetical protein
MFNELPEFRKTKYSYAMTYINGVLMGGDGASLVKLEEFDDHHFRVIFKISYFQLAEDVDMPSKSQWNTFKKKMKRRNHSVFVFREYGVIDCDQAGKNTQQPCLYIDFGFMYD